MVRELLGSQVQDVPALGFCWPSEKLLDRGKEITRLAVPLPEERKRRALWQKIVVKYAPFAVLQITPGTTDVTVIFETVYGASCWKLEGGLYLATITPCSGALALLWRGSHAQ